MFIVGFPIKLLVGHSGKPHVTLLLLNRRYQQLLRKTFTINRLKISGTSSNLPSTMAVSSESSKDGNRMTEFQGTIDRYNGVTIDSSIESCDTDTFAKKLSASLVKWQEQKVRGVWFKVALQHAEWVPILAKHEFWFHHARPEAVMMCRWLPESSEPCNIPSYCHTMVGVGGLVSDSQGRILVVKEKFWQRPSWKLPGGYLENGEDISEAAMREVLEETGIRTHFKSLVAFRHSHASQFNCSDIYLIVHLQPEDETQTIKKCEREIAECCWMKSEEFLNHPEVHALNRLVVRTFLENMKSGVSMPSTYLPHPFIKDKKVTIFNLHSDHESNSSSK